MQIMKTWVKIIEIKCQWTVITHPENLSATPGIALEHFSGLWRPPWNEVEVDWGSLGQATFAEQRRRRVSQVTVELGYFQLR